jgi:hypothetical protein
VSESLERRYVCVSGTHAPDGVRSFVAVLAYPSRRDWTKRKQFVMALRALDYRRFVREGGARRDVPAAIQRIKSQQIVGQLNRGFRKIGQRLSAGSVAYSMIFSGKRIRYDSPALDGPVGMEVRAPKTVTDALNELLKSKAQNTAKPYFDSGAALSNAMHRIWAESLPVLHLAIMLFQVVESYNSKSSLPLGEILPCLILRHGWFGSGLISAESLRTRLHQAVPTFKLRKAVRLLPTENAARAYLLRPRM